MTAASIVLGDTVVLKLSPDAPTIAARFLALMEEAGGPDYLTLFTQAKSIAEKPI